MVIDTIQRRRKTLRITDNRGRISITALYNRKNNNEQISRVNLKKITTMDQIIQHEELYVSIRPSEEIKIKRKNRLDLLEQEEEIRAMQQKISDQATEMGSLKAIITSLETQLAKANSENGELRSQLEKINSSQPISRSLNRQKKNSQKEDASFKIVANQVELEKSRSKPNPKYSAVSKPKTI
jgi:septal ring factor EnvC (AmiA/AmiB activator)